MTSSSSIPVFLLVAVPLVYASVFLHELGHVLIGRRCGFVVSSFGMGIGGPVVVLNWRGTKVYLCRKRPFLGLSFLLHPQILPSRRQLAWALGGGAAANASLAVAALALWRWAPWGGEVWALTAGLNAIFTISNLTPFSVKVGDFTISTDGAQILQVLRGGQVEVPAPARVQMVATLRGLWQSVGDRLGLCVHLTAAAVAWAELGDLEQAERLHAEAMALQPNLPPSLRSLGAFVTGTPACRGKDLQSAALALEEADERCRALDHEVGRFLVEWARNELLVKQGEVRRAIDRLDQLGSHSLLKEHPALRVVLCADRICAHAHLPDGGGAERLLAEYEAFPRQRRSLTVDLQVYRTMAGLYMRQEKLTEARAAYHKATEAARQLYESFTDAAMQARFAQCQAALVAEAKECVKQLGQDAEVAALEQLFTDPQELQRQRADAQQKLNRRYHRAGLLLTVANFTIGLFAFIALVVVGIAQPIPSSPLFIWLTLIASLVIFAALALLYTLLLFLVGRFAPKLRHSGGRFTLFLAVMPWIGWITLLFHPAAYGPPHR